MGASRTIARQPAQPERKTAARVPARAVAAATTAQLLQRRLGNQGTAAYVARSALRVSSPNDPAEKEAVAKAAEVMRMPAPVSPVEALGSAGVQRCACEQCASGIEAHRKEAGPVRTHDVSDRIHANLSAGSPLPADVRTFMEPRFGADFGGVRVHTGEQAARLSSDLNAHAFTVGNHIFFGHAQYQPGAASGKELIAHELTHVVQQTGIGQDKSSNDGPTKLASSPAVKADHVPPPSIARLPTTSPHIQRAWYNFSIPGTDYEFDPSIEGVKTAAGVVKDAAVSAFDWIVDEIESLVNAGIDWLKEKWNELKEYVKSELAGAQEFFTNIIAKVTSPLAFVANAIMNFDAQWLETAWATFSALLDKLANGFKAIADGVLGTVNKLWGAINSYATWVLNRLSSLTGNFLFRKLPDRLQQLAAKAIDWFKSTWKDINDGWNELFGKVKSWIDSAIVTVFGFVRRVLSFAINKVIAGILLFGQLVLFLKDLFSNPQKYVGLLAERSVAAFDGVETKFEGLASKYLGGGEKSAPSRVANAAIQHLPASAGVTGTKTSASWSEIGHGVVGMMGKKWGEFKANPLAVVKQFLIDMIFPMKGNLDDIVQLFRDIKKVVTGPLSASSLEELWTSILQILDIPILIYHTVVSILMRSLMVPLIVATFIPHPIVKAIAAAVGYGLLGAFVEAETLNLAHKLLLLKTGATTKAQKQDAYNRIADSLIALAMAAVIAIIMLLLHFIANVAKGVFNFIKGKVFEIEPASREGKGTALEGRASDISKDTNKPKSEGETDLGIEGGKRIAAEEPTADGRHKIKVTETGECLYCSNCGALTKEYAIELTDTKNGLLSELDVADQISNPKLKAQRMAQIEEKLAEVRRNNPHPNDPALARSARIQLLARDPAQGGKVTPKTVREAEVALSMEDNGEIQGPIQRDPSGAADFIDVNGKAWDVKGFNSHQPIGQGGFDLATDAAKVDTSLAHGENVIVDTGQMTPSDVNALKATGANPAHNWGDRVKFLP